MAKASQAPPISPSLIRLIYVSVASRALEPPDLGAIAAASHRNNAAQGLTGLLLFGGSRFYSVLEGPQRRVFARMERIITDPRHRDLFVVREDPIPAPRFANWSFASIPEGEKAPGAQSFLESFILGVAAGLAPS